LTVILLGKQLFLPLFFFFHGLCPEDLDLFEFLFRLEKLAVLLDAQEASKLAHNLIFQRQFGHFFLQTFFVFALDTYHGLLGSKLGELLAGYNLE